MASYPTSLANLATNKTNATTQSTDHPNHHNSLADELNAVQAELGLDPSGSSSTVKARLDTSTKGFVNHGTNASAARPSGYASVEWLGTVEPVNAANSDTWINA